LKSLSKSTASAKKEAQKLLVDTISKLNKAAQKAYNGNALVAVVTVEEHTHEVHSRSKRQAVDPNPYNLADLSNPDYPVIFNIIFWFTIVFVFALIAISLALGNVEDKDSIIYRMTGARGKKEN
jgi:renin receptor